jgi:hypothetical protein
MVHEALLNTANQHRAFTALGYHETTQAYLTRLAKAISEVTKRQFEAMDDDAQNWFEAAADALAEGAAVPVPEGFDRDALLQAGTAAVKQATSKPARTPKVQKKIERATAASPKLQEMQKVTQPALQAAATRIATPPPAAPEQPYRIPRPNRAGRVGETGGLQIPPVAVAPAPNSTPVKAKKLRPLPDEPISLQVRKLVINDDGINLDDIVAKLNVLTNTDTNPRRSTISTIRYEVLTTMRLLREAGWQLP